MALAGRLGPQLGPIGSVTRASAGRAQTVKAAVGKGFLVGHVCVQLIGAESCLGGWVIFDLNILII